MTENIQNDINEMLGKRKSGKRINSYAKGASYERLIAKQLADELGFEIVRVPMSGAFSSVHSSDIAIGDLMATKKDQFFGFCIECKHHNKANIIMDTLNKSKKDNTLLDWISQCEGDAGRSYRYPIVIFRLNRSAIHFVAPYKFNLFKNDIMVKDYLKVATDIVVFYRKGQPYVLTCLDNVNIKMLHDKLLEYKNELV